MAKLCSCGEHIYDGFEVVYLKDGMTNNCPFCEIHQKEIELIDKINDQGSVITNLNEDNTRLCDAIEDLEQANSLLQEALAKVGIIDLDDFNDYCNNKDDGR